MGVSFTAHSIIGIYVKRDLLYKTIKQKAFEHNFSEDQNFCPKTGKALWIEVEEPIPEYDGDDKLGIYKTVEDYDGDIVYCALFHNKDGRGRKGVLKIPDDFTEQKNAMKSYLEKLGLWNATFGLHSFLHCDH